MTDPLPSATQPSLGYAFCDMAVSVLAFVKIQMHTHYVFVQKAYDAGKINNNLVFEHLKHYV